MPWNPSDKDAQVTLSNGNLTANVTASAFPTVRSTISKSSGKWYAEITLDSGGFCLLGVASATATLSNYVGSDLQGYGWYSDDGTYRNNGGTTALRIYGTGSVLGIGFDATNRTLSLWQNGTLWLNAGSIPNLTGAIFLAASPGFGTTVTLNENPSAVPTGYTAFGGSNSGFSGSATLGAVVAGGSLQTVLSGFSGGGVLAGVIAGGQLGSNPGTFNLGPILVNGVAQANAALDFVRIYSDAGVLLYERLGGSLDSSGFTSITTSAAPPNTPVRIDWQLATGKRRMPRVTMG